ncbi:hypothetical protein FCV58_15045 [Vibrio sp. F13]|uniref:hypothetical protein n=1 Tax=Vibrio sp. F13 TaxID=2070777 RepID=UPI0010BD06CA|nr:hypothetical protein [Vibrio sp. F13]TKF64190.1 hypothetical protein FCV58_15045 [Vibrio sp. F13]
MSLNYELEERYDTVIIWGNGLVHESDILSMINSTEGFTIQYLKRFYPKSMSRFVKKVYSYDYAPIRHLKSKIKYLNSVKSEVLCIVIKNSNVQKDIIGQGRFRHTESMKLKELKSEIRLKFNRYQDGSITHEHVIHATDNENQTEHILKAIDGPDLLELKTKNLFNLPHFIKHSGKYTIKEVDINHLICAQLVGDGKSEHKNIVDSVQYKCLVGESDIYSDYIKQFRGSGLNAYYNVDDFLYLSGKYEYLAPPYNTNYVLVKEICDEQYLILDGLHRAAIHSYQENKFIKVCVVD